MKLEIAKLFLFIIIKGYDLDHNKGTDRTVLWLISIHNNNNNNLVL